jgi:hypothetical protein
MQKRLWVTLLFIFTIMGCNDTERENKSSSVELPTVTVNNKASILSKQSNSDIEAIKSQDNTLSFAYYTANKLTKEGDKRWYISQIDGSLRGYIFSLMTIVNDIAGWGEVSNSGASIDIFQENIMIEYIENNPTYEYKDWGLGTMQTDFIIQEDIELIRNSTVNIKWWFFKANDDNWYIVNNKSIYKFASKDGIYDWQKVEMSTDLNIEFFIEYGLKKMRVTSSQTEEIPQLNLNHKSETKEISKRSGCNFTDIYPDMFSTSNKEEEYITAICKAGIMQGDIFEKDKFRPYYKVDAITVAKVLSLVYDYDEVKKFCTNSIYENDETQCYVDFAKDKGMITPSSTTIGRYEFYTYLANIFWGQNFTPYDEVEIFDNVFDGWAFLDQKGIFFKSLDDEMSSDEYGIFSDLTRWELTVLALRCSRLSKEESISSTNGGLPYSITPDNNKLDDIEVSQILYELLAELFGDDEEFLSDLNEILFEDDKSEERKDSFFIPKNSLPETPNIQKTSIDELPNVIVKTATENIGKQSPYTDGKNTMDTRLITTVYGQDVKYESAKEMCADYEAQGKLEEGLPTDRDLKGSVVCYNDDTPGTDGKGHVAIISDSKGDKEIGVQDTENGVMERKTDKANIKGVIAPTDINLPNFH